MIIRLALHAYLFSVQNKNLTSSVLTKMAINSSILSDDEMNKSFTKSIGH